MNAKLGVKHSRLSDPEYKILAVLADFEERDADLLYKKVERIAKYKYMEHLLDLGRNGFISMSGESGRMTLKITRQGFEELSSRYRRKKE